MNKSDVIDAIYGKRRSVESYSFKERFLSDISYCQICSDSYDDKTSSDCNKVTLY
jgi:hypothetical protein